MYKDRQIYQQDRIESQEIDYSYIWPIDFQQGCDGNLMEKS